MSAADKKFVGETAIPNADACGVENVGQLITSGGICINAGVAVAFTETPEKYMLIHANHAPKGTPFKEDEYVVPILTGANYIVRSTFYDSGKWKERQKKKKRSYFIYILLWS